MTDDLVIPLPKNVLPLDCGCLLYVNSPKHHGVTLHCKDHRTKPEIENDEEGLQETVWWQASEIERLRGLLLIFDTNFVCEECDKACATYLQGCKNPLHALHTAAWELF